MEPASPPLSAFDSLFSTRRVLVAFFWRSLFICFRFRFSSFRLRVPFFSFLRIVVRGQYAVMMHRLFYAVCVLCVLRCVPKSRLMAR